MLLPLGFPFGAKAQVEIAGIYKSAKDFYKNKLSFSQVPGMKKDMLLDESLNSPSVKIFKGDSVYTFYKDSVFGYLDRNNACFRFYHKNSYQILNPSENILLYHLNKPGRLHANSPSSGTWYFSVNARSPIYQLTIHNLEIVFNSDAQFVGLLQQVFRYDDELYAYDERNKIYFLNRVLNESKLESEETRDGINLYEGKCTVFGNH